MTRYEDVKPKPMKQLLSSLMAIILKKYQGETRGFIQRTVLNEVLPCVILGEPRSRLKASLVVLEMCIRKGAISPSELMQLVQNWVSMSQDKWVPVYKKDYQALYPGTTDPSVMSQEPSEELAGRVLVFGLLTQTNNRGMSNTSGSIISCLLERSKSENPDRPMSWIWVHPAKHFLLQNLDFVEILSAQIMQPLFTLDSSGFSSFIHALPLQNLLAGDMAEASQSEYMLLFVSLQVGKKVNLVHDDCEFSKPSFYIAL